MTLRKFCYLVLCILFFSSCNQETPETQTGCFVKTGSIDLALRTKPTTSSEMILRIPQGEHVKIIRKNVAVADDYIWHKVKYSKQTGYIARWIECEVAEKYDPTKEKHWFYIDQLTNPSKAQVLPPAGKTNQENIKKWYIRYSFDEAYQGALRRGWERILADGSLPLIHKNCEQNNVPFESVFLALIESSWYPHPNNGSRAAGHWQFIPATARAYGLKVSPRVDERLDVEKSTDAAIRHLSDLHRNIGGWGNASSVSSDERWCWAFNSYNMSPGKVKKTFKRCGGDYRYYPIKVRNSESENYVAKIFAAQMWARDYVNRKHIFVQKSPADIAYEGYLEAKKKLRRKKQREMLEVVENMYRDENHSSEYLNGALAAIQEERSLIKKSFFY